MRLLLEFSKFCELKLRCPDLHMDEGSTPLCRTSGRRCEFEACPKVERWC